ncbi:MAG: type II secretion system secretin GspD [Paraperlucidibaca sp.]
MKKPVLKTLALCMMLLTSHSALAEKTWKINLKDADISALVSEMAEITGKNFVVDPRLKGNVTVISTREMSASELYELFQSVLSINGFAAVPSGPVIKILPDTNARQSGIRVDGGGYRDGEELVTRVVMLQQANALELLAALRPMMPQFAHLAAVPGNNALVISDRASNVEAMVAIIRDLDDGEKDDAIEIIPVKNGKASDLLNILETMESGAPAVAKNGGQSGKVRIVVDERTNRLLVRGDRALRDRVRAVIQSLDSAPDMNDDQVKVYRLKFASARQVAEVLKGVLTTDSKRSSSSSTVSTAAAGSGSESNSSPRGGASTTTITVEGASLIADETQNALIVRAKPTQLRQIESVLDDLDKRRAQVLIQAAIVEVSGSNAEQLGVQLAAGNPRAGVGVINFNNAGASLTSLAAGLATNDFSQAGIGNGAAVGFGVSTTNSNGDRSFYGALIQALNSVTDANLLSTPSIMTLDNQEAKIVVGQNVPFITGSTGTSGSGVTNPFTTIQRQDVGITLKVTPTITDGGTVRLDVQQEVSSVVPSVDGIQSSDIITNKRSIETSILADDGQTIVLGGLVQDDVTKSVSKVPFFGDLPGIGILFRSTSDTRTKRNLLVFLQPTIIRSSAQAASVTQRQYGAVRRIDLGMDAEGRLTKLPPNIQDIYQGGIQRNGGEQAANEPTVVPAPTPAPSQTPAARATVVKQPAVRTIPASPRAAQEEPSVYSADFADPIESMPMPSNATVIQRVPAPVQAAPAQPAAAKSVAPAQSSPAYRPPVVRPDLGAKPFGGEADDPVFAEPSSYTPPAQIRTTSGNVYTPQSNTAPTAPAPSATPEQQPSAAETTPKGKREIRTKSGNVYYIDE